MFEHSFFLWIALENTSQENMYSFGFHLIELELFEVDDIGDDGDDDLSYHYLPNFEQL